MRLFIFIALLLFVFSTVGAQIFDTGYQEPIARVTYTEEVLPDGTQVEIQEKEQIINRARRQAVEKKNLRRVDLEDVSPFSPSNDRVEVTNVQVRRIF